MLYLFVRVGNWSVVGSFYYRALQEGPASVVVPIDKLSMLVTIAFSLDCNFTKN